MLYNKADPGDAATELISIGFEHYRKFWQLREHFRKEDMQLFQLTAKAHHNCHACLLSAALNPRHRVSTQSLSSTFVPSLSLYLSLSLSLYIFLYIYIYIHMCVCTIVLKVRLLKRSWFSMWRFAYVLTAFALFVSLALCIHVYMYKPCRPPT